MLREYLAFISYSHADNKEQGRQWATWLHQSLESYEIPEDLIGKTNSRGEVIPERIFPIFRDEEELPANADLANSITHALEQSRLLIVLCSPNAVASSYVAEEIRYFKKLGHSDRIIAAMICGEPNASRDLAKQAAGISPETECFPVPLQFTVDEHGELTANRAEPVAADFRINLYGESQQGWCNIEAFSQQLKTLRYDSVEITKCVSNYRQQQQLMLLKIVAGILGVPLGELTQRDKAYQLKLERKKTKRLIQWLSGLALLALLAISTGFIAWTQKQLAVQNKNLAKQQAELAKNNEATALFELARNQAYTGNPVAAGISLLGALAKQEINEKHGEGLSQGLRSLISDILPQIGSEKQIPSPAIVDIRVESVSLSDVNRVAGLYRQTDTPNLDGFTIVWDFTNGTELMRLELDAVSEGFYQLKLSPSGQYLALWPTIEGGALHLHEVDTGEQYELDIARKPISEVTFSSTRILVGGFDGSVEAFDITSLTSVWLHETGDNEQEFGTVTEVVASDRHSAVLVNSGDETLILDLASGAVRARLDAEPSHLEGLTFDPDLPRAYFFDRSGKDNRIITFDLTNMTFDAYYYAGDQTIMGNPWGALLPRGKKLAYISGNGQLSWNSVENATIHSTRALITSDRFGHNKDKITNFEYYSISPNLQKIAFAQRDTGILSIFELKPQFWPKAILNVQDSRAETLIKSIFTYGPAGGIMSNNWEKTFLKKDISYQLDNFFWMPFSNVSNKGNRLLAINDFVILWKSNQILPVLSSKYGIISAIDMTTDEQLFVTGSRDGNIILWDLKDKKSVALWKVQHRVESISVLPDDDRALVMADQLYLLDFASRDIVEIDTAPFTSIGAAIYRNNERFALTSKSGMWIGILEDPTRPTFIREDEIIAATFLGESNILAIGTDRGLHLYDTKASVRIATLAVDTDSFYSRPDFMSFDPLSNSLIILSDMDLTLFDVSAYYNVSWLSALCSKLGLNLIYSNARQILSDHDCIPFQL